MSYDRGLDDGYSGGFNQRLYDRSESYREGFDYGSSLAQAEQRAAAEHAAYEQAIEEEYETYLLEQLADPCEGDRWADDGGA